MTFTIPWIFLALAPLVPYLWWMSRRSYAHLSANATRWGLALRALITLLLLTGMAQPQFESRTNDSHLAFLLDCSQSVPAETLDTAMSEIERMIGDASTRADDPSFTVIAFGESARILYGPSGEWDGWSDEMREQIRYATSLPILRAERTAIVSRENDPDKLAAIEERIRSAEDFRDEVAGEHTDVEQALRLAMNCGQSDAQRTILLFTDGQLNLGRWTEAWTTASNSGIMIHTIRLERAGPPEISMAELRLPRSVRVNEGFTARVRMHSTIATTAELLAYRDGFLVHQSAIELAEGENEFDLEGLYFQEKGFHTIEATVRTSADSEIRNNTIRSLVSIPGEARVLYVDGDEEQMPYLTSALELEGMLVDARPTTGFPQSLADLLSYDVFVLCNVPANQLNQRQMQMLRTYVQDFGGGFIMLGGDESFGLGGYYDTPVEEILPVRMPIQKDLIRPSLAIALVIDKSGSMDGVKIQLAKRAAIATSEAINPRDQIAVIGFDSASRILLDLTAAGDRATISNHIAELDAGGGTFMFPALRDAYERLQASNARRKHVIVLSDGQTEGFGYAELANAMASEGITISTVGIGEGADMRLLEDVAMNGGGRAYFTNDFFSIPQIFTREAMRASKNMLVERLVQPIVQQNDASLRGIEEDNIPLLTGYVATTPKSAAEVVMVSDSGDPLLAHWRYGLGRTAAFTSDAKPRWAEDWIRWPGFTKFWAQLIRSIAGENLSQNIDVQIAHHRHGRGVRFTVDLHDAAGQLVTDAKVTLSQVRDGNQATPVEVRCVAPAQFEAEIQRIEYGRDQQLVWRVDAPNLAEPLTVPYGFIYSYSPEYQTLGSNEEIFDAIARRGIGEVRDLSDTRELAIQSGGTARIRLWPALLAIALLLVPIDILIRRLA